MGIWIFGIVGLIVVWGVPPLLGLFGITAVTIGWRVALTAAVIGIVVLVLLYRRWRAGAQARALEREILKQSDEQLKNARPDRRAEITELRSQIESGIQALKTSKVGGKAGRSALYALPWYAIIGPPGAGKTTALKKSGLSFVLNDEAGAVKGVGGTRNCDWWFTNDAILLDTAGRYATQETDRNEWSAFLDLLRRFRSARPINGVIVAVSVSELMDQSEDSIAELSKKLRARIDELMNRLEMVVPVYVMFTKTDLIDGFVEFWGELRKSERDQIFGATFPLEAIPRFDPSKAFEKEFSRLVGVIHAHALRRIATERVADARNKIVQFPLEFHVLRNPLSYFIGNLFMRNRYQGTPLFRGFYFTSGTQEGSPVSRVVADMVHAFGLAEELPTAAAGTREAKSYFVTDLFRRVIFPDQSIAARTESQTRRRTLARVGLAVACLFAGLAIIVPATITFARNKSLIRSTMTTVQRGGKVDWSSSGHIAKKAEQLDQLRKLLTGLETWDKHGAPVGMTWGMYTGSDLLPGVRHAYARVLHEALALPTRPELEAQLRSFMTVSSDSAAYGRQYSMLKLYLMLGDPKHLDVDWAAPILTQDWAKALHSRDLNSDEKALAPHARYYLELLKSGEARPWGLDKGLIKSARSILKKAPNIERAYGIMVRKANADVAPIRQEDIFYGSAAHFFTSKKGVRVDGAYTKAGYALVMKSFAEREKLLTAESWVLAQPLIKAKSTESDKMMEKLRELYFKRYRDAWHDFFLDIQVKRPTSYNNALALLSALSEPVQPYRRLIETLAKNVRLNVKKSELGNVGKTLLARQKARMAARVRIHVSSRPKREKGREISPMEDAFEPLLEFGAPPVGGNPDRPPPGIKQYLGYLSNVVGAITDAHDSHYANSGPIKDQLRAAVRGTRTLLDSQSAYTRPLLKPLLLRPLDIQIAAKKPGKKPGSH